MWKLLGRFSFFLSCAAGAVRPEVRHLTPPFEASLLEKQAQKWSVDECEARLMPLLQGEGGEDQRVAAAYTVAVMEDPLKLARLMNSLYASFDVEAWAIAQNDPLYLLFNKEAFEGASRERQYFLYMRLLDDSLKQLPADVSEEWKELAERSRDFRDRVRIRTHQAYEEYESKNPHRLLWGRDSKALVDELIRQILVHAPLATEGSEWKKLGRELDRAMQPAGAPLSPLFSRSLDQIHGQALAANRFLAQAEEWRNVLARGSVFEGDFARYHRKDIFFLIRFLRDLRYEEVRGYVSLGFWQRPDLEALRGRAFTPEGFEQLGPLWTQLLNLRKRQGQRLLAEALRVDDLERQQEIRDRYALAGGRWKTGFRRAADWRYRYEKCGKTPDWHFSR